MYVEFEVVFQFEINVVMDDFVHSDESLVKASFLK